MNRRSARRRPGGLRLTLLLLAAAGASPAFGLGAEILPVRVTAPAPGARLVASDLAVVAWELTAGESLPQRIVEWEAFLSLDGGATYGMRLTPHLDISLRRFAFRVPDLPTRSARILLRFGDEEREVEVEAAGSFRIAGPGRGIAGSTPARAFARGEEARNGDGGVALWIDGGRDGSALREVAAAAIETAVRSARPIGAWALAGTAPLRQGPTLHPPAHAGARSPSPPIETATDPAAGAPRGAGVRLLIHRFNE